MIFKLSNVLLTILSLIDESLVTIKNIIKHDNTKLTNLVILNLSKQKIVRIEIVSNKQKLFFLHLKN